MTEPLSICTVSPVNPAKYSLAGGTFWDVTPSGQALEISGEKLDFSNSFASYTSPSSFAEIVNINSIGLEPSILLSPTSFGAEENFLIGSVYTSSDKERLIDLERRIQSFEIQSGMDSETFMDKWKKRELPDQSNYFEWSTLYRKYKYAIGRP